MSPCKKCIVRPACSKDCKELDHYIKFSSEIGTFFSILFGGICVVIMVYLFGGFSENQSESMLLVWPITFVINIYFNVKNEEKLNEIPMLVFSPFVFFIFIFLYLIGFYIKKDVRKRA